MASSLNPVISLVMSPLPARPPRPARRPTIASMRTVLDPILIVAGALTAFWIFVP